MSVRSINQEKQKPTLLVLAAGMGSRYGSLKQIDPIGPSGETIMDYSVYDALRAGFGKVVFVIRKNIEQDFRETLLEKFKNIIEVDYVFQELEMLPYGFSVPAGRQKPWGTAHAILVAENAVKTPFAVINADDFYGYEAFEITARFLEDKETESNYSMAGYLLKNTLSEHGSVSRGVCKTTSKGYLESIKEVTEIKKTGGRIVYSDGNNLNSINENTKVSMNFWGFTPAIFSQIKEGFSLFLEKNINDLKSEYYIPAVIDNLIKQNMADVRVLTSNSSWFGITYKEDKSNAEEHINDLIRKGKYPAKLW